MNLTTYRGQQLGGWYRVGGHVYCTDCAEVAATDRREDPQHHVEWAPIPSGMGPEWTCDTCGRQL